MNQPKFKRSKSTEIISKNRLTVIFNTKKCLSFPDVFKKNKRYEEIEEIIGYEIEQTSKNEIINTIKSFEINKNTIYKSPFLSYNSYCLTINSNYHKDDILNISANKKDKLDKGGEIFDNNKQYKIPQKSSKMDIICNKNAILNKGIITSNKLSKNNNDCKNTCNKNMSEYNFKTKENKIDNDKNNTEFNNSEKIEFDEISIVSKIKSDENININLTGEEEYFLKENDIENNKVNNNKFIINKIYKEKIELEQKIKNEYLTNKELKNYIEILKQILENNIIKYGFKDNLNKASKKLNKNPIDFLSEFTKYKTEYEKIKKNLIIQQVITAEMKKEIECIKKENDNLKKNKNNNIDNNINGKNNISDNCLNISNNIEHLENLSKINKELNENYMNLQNDFNLLSQNNEDIINYNKKLINENQQFKKEIKYLKEIYIKEKKIIFDKENEITNTELYELKNKINHLEKLNKELKMHNELQSNEIGNLKDSLNKKNEEVNKCYNEIKSLKNNELIKEKEEEIFKLKKQNERLEKSINGIFDEKIMQNLVKIKNMNIYKKENKCDCDNELKKCIYEMDVNNKYNLENKLEIISNFLTLVIEHIVYFDAKLKSQNEQIIKRDIFSDNQKSSKELFNINSNDKEKNIEKDNIINFNFNDIENSFEEFSVIKQKENQNNSNYDFCFSNNNLIINKDIDDYINLKNKLDNIYINKYENNKNYDDNKELINFEKNKLYSKKTSIDIKTKRISNINNINKSLSTRQIKYKNFNSILNDKIKEMNADKKNLNFRKKEEEKINNNDAQKNYNLNKENNIKNNEIFYISMPSKFTEKQENIFSKKKK